MATQPHDSLFTPYKLGALELKNRLVMAPMTRSRALVNGNVPNPLAVTYYTQRASAGLIITEGTQVSLQGVGYIRTPGMHSSEQVRGWKTVTDAVHAAGGRIYAQLWHTGRMSHPDFHGGALPVAPSAIGLKIDVFTFEGKKPTVTPRALEKHELPGVIEQFRRAAQNALAAGFDGVELHGSNGYLLDQFLRDSSNQRTDEYGGSPQNRARFPLEVTRAVAEVWGAERVGYRVLPSDFPYGGMADSTPAETFSYLARELGRLGLGYLHVTEDVVPRPGQPAVDPDQRLTPLLRKAFPGTLIANGGYDAERGAAIIARGEADLVAFGVPFLANPDLPERYRSQQPLNPADPATFFSGEERGYTDYPALR